MKENNAGGDANNEDENLENVNVEKEMAGLIDIFNEQKKRHDTKNSLTPDMVEAVTEKKGSKRYQEKMQALKEYIPVLRRVIDNMDSGPNQEVQNSCRQKLEIVYTMIEKPKKDKPLKYECLEKLERILKTIAIHVKVKKSSRVESPSLKSPLGDDDDDLETAANRLDQPGPSGVNNKQLHQGNTANRLEQPGPSGVNNKQLNQGNTANRLEQPGPSGVNNKQLHQGNTANRLEQPGPSGVNNKQLNQGKASASQQNNLVNKTSEKESVIGKASVDLKIDKVPSNKSSVSSNKTSVNKKSSSKSYHKTVEDVDLFTPDPNVSKVRPGTSNDYPRSFTESGLHRPRCQLSGAETRPTHSFTPKGERYKPPLSYTSAPYYDKAERVRGPYPECGGRYRAPFSERFRAPYSDNDVRYKNPSPERHRTTSFDKTERYRAPYLEDNDRCRASYDVNMGKHQPLFTDTEEKYYEKPKNVKKSEKVETETSGSFRKKSEKVETETSVSFRKKSEKVETETFELKKTKPHERSAPCSSKTITSSKERGQTKTDKDTLENSCRKSVRCISSSAIDIESSLSSRNILDHIDEMQQKDLEKLTNCTQQLKSHLNNRLKNMQAQRLLIASNKDGSAPFSTSKRAEISAYNRENEEAAANKSVTSEELLTKTKITQEADAFLDNLMSNLSTKFCFKRGPTHPNGQEKSTSKPETIVSNQNAEQQKLSDNDKLQIMKNVQEIEFIKKPFLSDEDKAEVISKVKEILIEKSKLLNSSLAPTSNIEKGTVSTPVCNNEPSKSPTDGQVVLETSKSQTSSCVHNTEGSERSFIQIPGLDGIIPPELKKSSDTIHDGVTNKTKDFSVVTKELKGISNQSSRGNFAKSNFSEIDDFKGSCITSVKERNNPNDKVNDLKQNRKLSSNHDGETTKLKQTQSIRSKLTGEISTLHKVGTPVGGALRGLVKRDKMMPSGQIASLKPGALYDLISEDKPRSALKNKVRSQLPQNCSFEPPESSKTLACANEIETSGSLGKTKTPDDILSKLSENDLKKIITDNIGALPTPPNLPFLNNAASTSVNNFTVTNISNTGASWNNQSSSMLQNDIQSHNVAVNNINVLTADNTTNNTLINQQSVSNWGRPDNEVWKASAHIKDPRRESQLAPTNATLSNSTGTEGGHNLFSPIPDVSSFERPTYSSSIYGRNTEPFKGNDRETSRDSFYFQSFNPSVVLQSDPYTSPCYDGSATPDPYRPDPYTMNLKDSAEKQSHGCSDTKGIISAFPRPSRFSDPSTFEPHANYGRELTKRAPLLALPPVVPRPSLLGTPSLTQERELYPNFNDNQNSRFNDPRNSRRAGMTYAEWKAEKNRIEDHRNMYRYTDHQANQYNDTSCRSQLKDTDVMKKLSARDPRRKSIDDTAERKDSSSTPSFSKTESSNQDWCSRKTLNNMEQVGTPNLAAVNENIRDRQSQRDPRRRDKTPPRGRSVSRDPGRRYGSRERSSSRGPYRGRSPSRQTENPSNKGHRNEKNKDVYSSPLDQLYANTSDPKTGLGYGFQKFRIPKVNKGPFELGVKSNNKESPSRKDSNINDLKSRDLSVKELDNQKADTKSVQEIHELSEECIKYQKKEENEKNEDSRNNDNEDKSNDNEERHDSEDNQIHIKQLAEGEGGETKEDEVSSGAENKDFIPDDELSAEDEETVAKKLPFRRSRRLIKKRKGRPPKSKKEQLNVEEEKSSSMKDQLPSFDAKNVSDDEITTPCKNTMESESSHIEDHKISLCEKTSAFDDQLNPEEVKKEVENKPSVQSSVKEISDLKIDVKPNEVDESPVKEPLGGKDETDVREGEGNSTSMSTSNSCDSTNTDPEIKIIKQVELLQDVFGIKLTPDKIRKMAEILNVAESKEKRKEKQPEELVISNQMKSVPECSSDVLPKDDTTKIIEILSKSQKTESTEKYPLAMDENPLTNDENSLAKDENPFTKDENPLSKDENPFAKDGNNLAKNVKQLDAVASYDDDDDGQETVNTSETAEIKEEGNECDPHIHKEDLETESASRKRKRKYKNELDRLQDDISKYHDSEAIAAASGPRQCRLKEKNQITAITHQNKTLTVKNIKKAERKWKEDELDNLEGTSQRECTSKNPDDELNDSKESAVNEVEEEIKEEPPENNYQSDSSDDSLIQMYNEKMKSKYQFILQEEAKRGQSSHESRGSSDTELITSSVNTKDSEIHNKDSEIKKPVSGGTDNSNKSCNNQLKSSSDSYQPTDDYCPESFSETELTFDSKEKQNEDLENYTLPKSGLKKQRKKSFWSAGIIRRKSKSKRSASSVSSTNEDNIDTLDPDMEDDEVSINEKPDLNYYQEGDAKATKCKLCSFYGKSIVTHYAITHPKDEVLISRMSPIAAKIAIKESEVFFSLNDERKRDYSSVFECRVCYLKFSRFSSFFEHIALHTGEFRHECCKCGYRTSTRSGILKHYQSHNVKNTNNKSCRVLYKEPVDKSFFCGYLCSLCNYFQISQKNVKRHVENVHEVQDFNNVVKINFSKVSLSAEDIEVCGKKTVSKTHGDEEPQNAITNDAHAVVNNTSGALELNLMNESSDTVASENCCKHNKSANGDSLIDDVLNANVGSTTLTQGPICSKGDLTVMTESLMKPGDMTKYIESEGVSTQNSKQSVINDSTNIRGNSGASVSKNENTLSSWNNEKLDSTAINEKHQSYSVSKDESYLHLKDNAQSIITPIGDDLNSKIGESKFKETLISNVSEDAADAMNSLNVTDNLSSEEISDPIKEKEQQAAMIMQNDWFISLCKNISEINNQYLIDRANPTVSSRVQKLRMKANLPNIADQVSQRCVSDLDEALPLNELLQVTVNFKVERKLNMLSHNEYLSQKDAAVNEVEDTIPSRRQLPDRTCKLGFTKIVNERDGEEMSDVEDDTDIYQLLRDTGDHEQNWNDDVIVKEEIISESELVHEIENSSSGNESNCISLPCLSAPIQSYLSRNTNRRSLSIQDKFYTSSLPVNSNFSEFTHVMKQISQVSLKVSEIKKVKVGGLEVLPSGSGVMFSCSVKIFNKECGFQTSDLECFGQHVNMSHHTAYWNGVCCSCLVHFLRDPNSHDKVIVNTQSKAFCHLVREHLTFTKKTTKPASRGSLTANEAPVAEETPPPRLRVRRFSGDKLSGTDAENILPQPAVEVTGPGELDDTLPAFMSQHEENSSFNDVNAVALLRDVEIPPTEEEKMSGVKIFKPFNNIKGAKPIFKMEKVYKAMCIDSKLRHLYKCMGAQCSFTTISLKEFARHFDDHRDIYVVKPDDDPHKGFWNVCSYCLVPQSTSRDLCIHIRKEHGICLMQCSLCFYRAKSIANVHFHHTYEHTGQRFIVLLCDQTEMNLPPFIEKPFTEFVSAFRCSLKETCSLFTYMLHTFCNHLKMAHPDDLRCHLCMEPYLNIKSLLQHYSKVHGIGLYQCLFCTFGAATEHEIRLHLCYVHPSTDPKALQRTDNAIKPQNTGLTNRESIKRLMFYKDQDKLLKYVNGPTTEEREAMRKSLPNVNIPINEDRTAMSMSNWEIDLSRSFIPQSVIDPPPENENNWSMLESTVEAVSTFRPAILRAKRPASETSSPSKVLLLSPQKRTSNEEPKTEGSTSPLPLAASSSSLTIEPATSDNTPFSRTESETTISGEDRDSATPEIRSVSSLSNTNENDPPNTCEAGDPNYFKCGNKGCSFEASTSAPLKTHLVICDQARQSQKLSCVVCHRVFKQVGSFVEHLRAHGPERYSCSLCSFKASILSRVNSHMKTCHHVFITNVVPVDPTKHDPEKDYFIVNGKEKRKGEKPGPKGKTKNEIKTKFSIDELDDVPKAAIFQNLLGCRLCSYETKVRSNLIRHIQQHSSGDLVSQEEVVNPVPEKTEKMFDKMMNLAGSSHKKKSELEIAKEEAAVDCVYKYVSDQDRYMCHVKECGYRTLSETMLRDHISVIHKDETHYLCPHCIEVDFAAVPIDQLGMHLKLHDSPVFKCAYCHFCSHIKRSIERHVEVLHPGLSVTVLSVRLTKPDQNVEHPSHKFYSSDRSDEQGEEWYCCNHCVFKTKKKKIILQHGVMEHKMSKPFKCSSCGYESLTDQIFKDHFNTYHPDTDCQLISLYKKVTELKKPVLPPIPPLWKRDAKRLKLIRGIKLDEKGDAPPPVATATTGIEGLDVLELKFGHFGTPVGTSFMCPRCSTSFMCKNRQEMKEHLYKDFEYSPLLCKICKIGSTQRTKIMKHINKVHNIEWDRISEFLDLNLNEELESWVDKVLLRQQTLMSENSATDGEPARKRPRPSTELPPLAQSGSAELYKSDSQESIPSNNLDEKDDLRGRERRKRDTSRSKHRFGCEYCNVTTKYKHSIILHSKKIHPDKTPQVITLDKVMDEKIEAFNCMYCKCTALDVNNLKHHWSHTHKNSGLNFLFRNTVFNTELEYECYWCKKRSDLESLEEHCRDDHSVDQRFLVVSISVPKYKCSECPSVFKSVEMVKRHFLMAHPSKTFVCILLDSQRSPPKLDPNTLLSSSLSPTSNPRSSITFKCFDCSYTSPKFKTVMKHMQGHFLTYICYDCGELFPSEAGHNTHMLNKHPLSNAKPQILRGSDTDFENAKKNIMVISEFGEKRKITDEELAKAEKENETHEENIDGYTYDDPLEVQMSPPAVRETARKSTGSPRKRLTPPKVLTSPSQQDIKKSPTKLKKSPFKVKRKKLDLSNMFVSVRSHGKIIRLPAETLRKLVDIDARTILEEIDTI